MSKDHVATIIEQWHKERPDLDPSPMAIIGRLSRLSRSIDRRLEENFKKYDLQSGTFDLLATLRRNGEPFMLTPTQLQGEMMLSSGATTHRLDLLEKRGFIERLPDPEDRRGTLIKLTPGGKDLIDRAVVTHIETENEMLATLDASQKCELTSLLAQLAQAVGL
jgi:DNA-binding MarR family transcriptional regulator